MMWWWGDEGVVTMNEHGVDRWNFQKTIVAFAVVGD